MAGSLVIVGVWSCRDAVSAVTVSTELAMDALLIGMLGSVVSNAEQLRVSKRPLTADTPDDAKITSHTTPVKTTCVLGRAAVRSNAVSADRHR